MRAWTIERYGEDLSGLVQTDREAPKPGAREVLVRVRATSLNYRDLLVIEERYPGGGLRPGLIPLSDCAGEVVEAGPRVQRVRAGDRVAGNFNPGWIGGPVQFQTPLDLGAHYPGVLAEYRLFGEEEVVRLPDALSFEEGAALPCAAVTAWSGLIAGQPILPGETVLVQGTGGVSVFALQLAKAMGARVIATTSSDVKADRFRALGADEVVDYVRTPEWGRAVRAATGGRGVDRVIEVGGPDTFGQSLAAVARGGAIAVIGFVGGIEGAVNPMQIFMSGAAIYPISVGSRADFEKMLGAFEAGSLRPVIDRVFSFEEAVDAYRHLQSQQHIGKIVISLG
jgi:NADPH:quinone reductase-like Zn-dependent oxidoreductase